MKEKLLLIAFCLCSVVSCGGGKVKHYTAEVVAQYPHDTLSYTQGLFFHDGKLYESTGLNGLSTLRQVDLQTGEAIQRVDFEEEYFAEGSVAVGNEILVMTWQNNVLFHYGLDSLNRISSQNWPREGWGITTDGKHVYASDGSSHIYVMDMNLHLEKRLSVSLDGHPVRWLNELEFIDGRIWANVYVTDNIVMIDPKSGKVTGVIDCSQVYPQAVRRPLDDVLNGIAWNPSDGKTYIAGKNWPAMYEITLRKRD